MNRLNSIRFIRSVARIDQIPQMRLPEIAVVGRSNVGKSSFINTLFNRKNIARVSSVPGKTQQINFFLVSDRLYLVDLPGYGYKKISLSATRHWAGLIESYLRGNDFLKLVFLLIDCRHEPQNLDFQMITWLQQHGIPFEIILTKRDKLSNPQFSKQLVVFRRSLPSVTMIPFSSKTLAGKTEVLDRLEKITEIQKSDH
jgi:GTP-binding protein